VTKQIELKLMFGVIEELLVDKKKALKSKYLFLKKIIIVLLKITLYHSY